MYSASLFLQQISYSESNSDATSDAEYNNVSSKDQMWKLANFWMVMQWTHSDHAAWQHAHLATHSDQLEV